MSTTFYSNFVVGIRVTKKEANKTEQWFNERTGKPYDKEVKDGHTLHDSTGKVIYHDSNGIHDGEKFKGSDLTLHQIGGCYSPEYILGVEIADVDTYSKNICAAEVSPKKLKSTIDKVAKELVKFGTTGTPSGFVVMSWG